MLTEAIEGENILLSGENQVEKLRSSLGLVVSSSQNLNIHAEPSHNNLSTSAEGKNQKKKRRPGERNANRDIVGGGENAL